jgi:phage-related protein
VFTSWGSFFSGLWDKIKSTFSDLGTNISDAISSSVKSGINGVISMIESTVNSGISLINGAINLANKIPGVSVGTISSLSLPRLAKGGIIDEPTIAEIGEQGREAVIPLENNKGWIKEQQRSFLALC